MWLSQLKNDVVGYFSETTVHGFKYVVHGRNIYERMAWLVVIAIGFALCSFLIIGSSQVWRSDPVQTTLDQVSIPVHHLPFPAITVCDTESLQMPRRNRWMFLENVLNTIEIRNVSQLVEDMYPCKKSLNLSKAHLLMYPRHRKYVSVV